MDDYVRDGNGDFSDVWNFCSLSVLFNFIQFYSVAHRVLRFYRKILIFTPRLTSHLGSIGAELLRNRNIIRNFIVLLKPGWFFFEHPIYIYFFFLDKVRMFAKKVLLIVSFILI
jgi:hypothetical protein